MYNAKTNVGECHTGNVLCHGHTIACLSILGLVDGGFQIACNHLNSLEFEHVAHLPCTLGDETLDGMCESIHTGGGGEAAGQGVHQFGIDNGHDGDVVGVNAHHLLLVLLVGDNVVDGHLGSSTGGGGQGNDGH